jgi:hypothetical protein
VGLAFSLPHEEVKSERGRQGPPAFGLSASTSRYFTVAPAVTALRASSQQLPVRQHASPASQQAAPGAQQLGPAQHAASGEQQLAFSAADTCAPAAQQSSHTSQHSRQSVEQAGQGVAQHCGAAVCRQQPPDFATGHSAFEGWASVERR